MISRRHLSHTRTLSDTFNVVFDPYSLDVEIEKDLKPPPLYWRICDRRHILEVGLHRQTGRLLSVTVALYGGELTRADSRAQAPSRELAGVPAFDLSLWPATALALEGRYADDFVDNDGAFQMRLARDQLLVGGFGPGGAAYRVVTGDRLACDFNDQAELCSLVLLNLTGSELAAVEGSMSVTAGF